MEQWAAEPQRLTARPAGRGDLLPRLRAALGQVRPQATSDFDLNPGLQPPAGTLREAGVLIAITPDEQLILTKRSSHLRHHPGQIAFPGGKVDPGDAGPVGAALREAEEEVGLPRHQVEVLGTLPQHITITSFAVTPVVALVPGFAAVPEAGEVEEVFRVPLSHVLDPASYQVQYRSWQGGRRGYYVVPYGPYYIWGATARMLRVLAAVMA